VNAIIPLAGPDFIHPRFGVRPLVSVEGEPLIRRAITSRPWWRDGSLGPSDLVFVLRDLPEAHTLRGTLLDWFPGARVVFLSDLTGGALLSALAAVALLPRPRAPLCVDLVDILYDSADAPSALFADPAVGGVLPCFPSDEPCYSYAEIGADGAVIRTVEKRVISSHASAGTYVFRDAAVFLRACAHSLDHAETLAHKGALFLCPAMNGVIAQGLRVLAPTVTDVRPVSKRFGEEPPQSRQGGAGGDAP
jgi:hypothetical protein